MKSIELLAPAKDLVSAIAAVDYGADAIYIGGPQFGARYAAANTVQDIGRAVEYARRYGVRVYAALNTLLYDDELAAAQRQARELVAAGVGALIVQDMALLQMSLPIELHASTQACNRTAEHVRFLGEAGFARVILERALSIDQIREICGATTAQVECFVHGAICVGYSGRCFLSRSMAFSGADFSSSAFSGAAQADGPRSGNRGSCSQPCRLSWDLTDGAGRTYIAGKYLLSLRDLNLSERIGELLDVGVTSFKIEGRLKDLNYIRNIVAHYRRAVDRALAGRSDMRRASVGESALDFTPDPAKSFTRGESEYFFAGKHAGVASMDTPKAVGEPIGRVERVDAVGFWLGSEPTLAPGDGICFMTPAGLAGTNINAVDGRRIAPNSMEGIAPGVEIYRNYNHRFNLSLERSRTRRVIAARAVVEVSASGVRMTYTDCEGVVGSAMRQISLDAAKNPEANAAALRTQAAKSGDTIFAVREVEIRGGETVEGRGAAGSRETVDGAERQNGGDALWFVPASAAAEVRREALDALLAARLAKAAANAKAAAKATVKARASAGAARIKYPSERLTAEHNVTNCLAEEFYRDHGVTEIERGLDLHPSTRNRRVMQTSYCIRREIGQCLLEKPRLRGDLYLEHGAARYRLDFDCALCEMSLTDCIKF